MRASEAFRDERARSDMADGAARVIGGTGGKENDATDRENAPRANARIQRWRTGIGTLLFEQVGRAALERCGNSVNRGDSRIVASAALQLDDARTGHAGRLRELALGEFQLLAAMADFLRVKGHRVLSSRSFPRHLLQT